MAFIYPVNGSDAAWLIYQDISGCIRRLPYTKSGVWNISESLLIEDVFNTSSLATISYLSEEDGSIVVRTISIYTAFT